MRAVSFRYGRTLVEIMDGWVRTTLPDGTAVHATPGTTEEDIARARSLGYGGDCWLMTRDHDRFHAMLAYALDLPESPALRATARGDKPALLTDLEEAAVLGIQRYVQELRAKGML
jgi:hypothetical protein